MHKVDEAVSLKDLKNLTKIYQNILQNFSSEDWFITSDTYQNHDTGPWTSRTDCKISVIIENLKKYNNKNILEKPLIITVEIIKDVHDASYVDLVKNSFPSKGLSSLDGDTII